MSQPLKLYLIADGLYVRGHTEHLPLATKQAAAEQYHLGVVVNLWSRIDEDWSALVPWYLHRPIPDGPSWRTNVPGLRLDVQRVAAVARRGRGVLVQCHAGRNRAGLFAALVLRELKGYSGERALAHVRAARPNAIANEDFADYLRALPRPTEGWR